MDQTPAKTVPHGFSFEGSGGEYFGIWIVNLLLTIITLGIYSAWAKVRRLRYFYGNTILDGHNLEYHANPVSILIGRIIVVVALILYNVVALATPIAAVLIVPYLFALPWLINRSLRFNARVTSYRNIRFDFQGSYWRAFMVFIIWPVLALFTLGLLVPFVSRAMSRYIGSRLRFGTSEFKTDPRLGPLYGNLGLSVLLVLAAAAIAAGIALLGVFGFNISEPAALKDRDVMAIVFAAGPITIVYAAVILGFVFYSAGRRNIAYNATTLGGMHRFSSNVHRLRYVWILFSNLVVIVCTIGLMKPWATVRTWRYLADHTWLHAAGSLDGFVATKVEEGSAAPAEYLDFEGIDFGI